MKALVLNFALVLLLALYGGEALAQKGNASRGLEKSAVCHACHGQDGTLAIDANTPILAGQHAGYLEHSLRQYRSGERQDPLMSPFAMNLSDQDIADLAAWYASQEGLVVPRLNERR